MTPTLSLDYYIGRKVEAVDDGIGSGERGDDTPVWSIRLEGDVLIHNFSTDYPLPPSSIVGLALQMNTLSSPTTTIYFGTSQNPQQMGVHLHGEAYGIADPLRADLGIVFPQRSEAFASTIPKDPSDERVADKPDDDWLASIEPEEED